ncbi:MAG TPA: SRPBCC domain-containing protein [Dongiaceae bacterium]|nr:SRPBCC domain-containing protein [Dongiaceae bacterium]
MAPANSAPSHQEIEERTLVLTRIFDAPRALLFKVWTQPEHLARWWGPRGYTLMTYKTDVRVGGSYRFGVRSPENTEHWAHGTYHEVAPPEKLVFTYAWENPDGSPKHDTTVTLTFAEQDGKTKLTLKQTLFESVTACDLHRGGWSSSFDSLNEYLATL